MGFAYTWLSSLSRPVMGLGFAAALALLLIARIPHQTEMQTMELTATRSSTNSHVNSSKIPRLQLVVQGFPEAFQYQVDIVDAAGKSIWDGIVNVQGERLVVMLPSPLPPGRNWVRVYSDSSRASLLREYSVVVD